MARWIVAITVVGLAVGGVGLLAMGGADPASIKRAIDRASPDGSSELYPLSRIAVVQRRALVAGIALALSAAALAARGRWASRHVGALLPSIGGTVREGAASLRRFVRLEPVHAAVLLGIVALGIGLRVMFIHQAARSDEVMCYLGYVSRSLPLILTDYAEPVNHVLNTVLEHFTVRFFGPELWVLRLPALIAGSLLPLAAYAFVRRVYERDAALLAAGMVACSAYLVHYSVNGRGYSLVCLLFMLVMTLGHAAVRTHRPALWWGYAAAGALGFFTLPTMLLAEAGAGVWLLLTALRGREATREERIRSATEVVAASMLMGAMTLLLYLPMLVMAGPGQLARNKWVKPQALSDLLVTFQTYGDMLLGYVNVSVPPTIAMVLLAGFVAAVAGDVLGRRRVSPALAVAAGAAVILVVQRVAPFPRVWTFVLPLYLGLGAVGISAAVRRLGLTSARHSATMGVVTLALCWPMAADIIRTRSPADIAEGGYFPQAQAAAAAIHEIATPSDRLLMTWPAGPAVSYYGVMMGVPRHVLLREGPEPPFTLALVDAPLEEFNRLLVVQGIGAPVAPERLEPLRQFDGATLYRIHPAPSAAP